MNRKIFAPLAAVFLLLLCARPLSMQAQSTERTPSRRAPSACSSCIRAHEEFLASDALRGRGSGSADEWVAATYIAAQLRQYGIPPAGDQGSYLQRVILTGKTGEPRSTWNVLGILPGKDAASQHSAILLSAHLDHLGVGAPVNGDDIYHGADDDASGVTAVLELARVLGHGPRPLRTVVFALFGSEELGVIGSRYFLDHPPLPLQDIAANLEFEMIGRRDAAVEGDTLWLTGWERSNLGPELAAHGAKLVADPHPKERFFTRSDNYLLAKRGLVAQTVSSYGLHKDYHQPSDDLQHLDFRHMDAAIASLISPIEWLVNSDFQPKWKDGGRP